MMLGSVPPRILWPATAGPPRLGAGDVHLWCLPLDAADGGEPDGRVLSDDERARAARLRFPGHRRRFVRARAALREILARYLAVSPADLQFTYGPCGKPALAGPAAGRRLEFNLAHSGALALCAVTADGPVGADLEEIRPLDGLDLIAARFFAPSEAAWLRRLGPGQQHEAFFQLWTQKEALIKARGGSLGDLPPTPAFTAGAPRCRWIVARVQPAAGYAAAIALPGPCPRLQAWRWVSPPPATAESGRRPATTDGAPGFPPAAWSGARGGGGFRQPGSAAAAPPAR